MVSYVDFPAPPDPMLKPIPQIPDTRGAYDDDDPNDCWAYVCEGMLI